MCGTDTTAANMSTSPTYQAPGVDSFAATDFKDLIDSMQTLETTTKDFIREDHTWEHTDAAPYCSETQWSTVEQRLKIVRRLETEFQELDSHYGWVLASDYALVAKVIAQQAGEGVDARDWMKNVYERHVKTRSELAVLREILCDFVENPRKHHWPREATVD